jgi:expansin (peptidoglycan-binding protein)
MSRYIIGLMPKKGKHREPKTLSQVNDLIDKTDARIILLAMSERERDKKIFILERERDKKKFILMKKKQYNFFVVEITRENKIIEDDIRKSVYTTLENIENIESVEYMSITVQC